jgi:cation:H+ antiporter
LSYFLIIGGFILLLLGAEIMLRGAIGIAEKFGISKFVVGMTIVAFGTSAPELLVSLNAVLSGSSGLAIGNVVGSNIANILLVLGIAGLLMPIPIEPGVFKRDGWMLIAGTGLFAALALSGEITTFGGLALLVYFVGFLLYSYVREKKGLDAAGEAYEYDVDEIDGIPQKLLKILVYLVIGFAGLIYGADILVQGCVAIAKSFGVSEAVIGLTVVAFGTSLPELAATIVAAIRKHSDVAIGNIVGSNIFNVVGVIGVVGVITPLDVPSRIINFDVWIMLAASLILMPYMIGRRDRLGRVEALLFLAAYLIYIGAIGYGVETLIPV